MVRSWFCRSCLVTYLCDDSSSGAGDDPSCNDGGFPVWGRVEAPMSGAQHLALDADEVAALGTLQRAGLAPVLRHSRLVPLLGGRLE